VTSDRPPQAVAGITLHHRLEPEDQARADFYALLARLYADAPDAPLLRAIAAAPGLDEPTDGGGGGTDALPAAWQMLRAASEAMDAAAAADEYFELFVGVGKSPVSLLGSFYLSGLRMEKPLVAVRATLSKLGLARQPEVSLVEDHLAALLETMRILIAGQGERRPASIADQKEFFAAHLESWVFSCCNAISVCPVANYYRRVAKFTNSFMALERDSFAID
jgi:TorA maturation chaperone TorD